MDIREMTVDEFLFGPCSPGVLQELAEDSEYWEGVQNFVEENSQEKLETLSKKQVNWLLKIKDALLEEAGA